MINVGLVGYGYWGPNLARNFQASGNFKLLCICDSDEGSIAKAKRQYPHVDVVRDYKDLLKFPVDLVAIATPVESHFYLAKAALLSGRHIFVEKPFTASSNQAKELIDIAGNGLKIMVDHTFLFTGAIKTIKKYLDDKEFGDLFYYDSVRINLGMFQHDVNVIWDLAPHDFYIINYLFGKPKSISVNAATHLGNLYDMAHITAYHDNNFISSINVNWLSPVKIRQTLIGGSEKMLMWNDLEVDEKIKIYNKKVVLPGKDYINKTLISYRMGDIVSPKIENKEALACEIEYLHDYINLDIPVINDGVAGLEVVDILEACTVSAEKMGKAMNI